VLATYLKCLRYVKEDGEKFSIRQWIQSDNNDRWLFITSGGRQHEAIKPLITLWLNLAGTALLDLVPNYQRRIWMTLDELPSLHQLPFLLSQLAEVRKFGGCMILGVQNIAHLRSVYGTHDAQTIADLCNTRLFLRSNDADVARWVSNQLGEADIEEMRESISYGANTMRDGVSLQRQRTVRPIVLGSEIQSLNDRDAYLQLPGQWPITKLTFPLKLIKSNISGFEPRELASDVTLDNAIATYSKAYVLLGEGSSKEEAPASDPVTSKKEIVPKVPQKNEGGREPLIQTLSTSQRKARPSDELIIE